MTLNTFNLANCVNKYTSYRLGLNACRSRRESRVSSEVNIFVGPGENEDEKLNEVMYEAWRFNRDCKLLRDGLQGLSWDGQYHFILALSGRTFFVL